MNLRDLEYLVAVAEQRHFGRAAAACHVSQPTLSAQIRKLEGELGVTLFERGGREVAPTPVGAEILAHARVALDQAAAIRALAQDRRDPLAGPLRLGVIPTLGPYVLPFLLGPLKAAHPRLGLVLTEEVTDRLLAGLADRSLDAALVATPPEGPGLIDLPLFDEPFWLAHPAGHDLQRLERVRERDLARPDLLLLADGHCLREQALGLCRLAPAPAAGDLRAASLETLIQLVAAGFGYTLVPALALRGSWANDPRVVVRPLALAGAARRVRLVHRAGFPRRAAVAALAEVVRANLPQTVALADQPSAAAPAGSASA